MVNVSAQVSSSMELPLGEYSLFHVFFLVKLRSAVSAGGEKKKRRRKKKVECGSCLRCLFLLCCLCSSRFASRAPAGSRLIHSGKCHRHSCLAFFTRRVIQEVCQGRRGLFFEKKRKRGPREQGLVAMAALRCQGSWRAAARRSQVDLERFELPQVIEAGTLDRSQMYFLLRT